MILIGVLFILVIVIAVTMFFITKSLIFVFLSIAISLMAGLIGGIIALLIQTAIDSYTVKEIEDNLFNVVKGRKQYKINKERFANLYVQQNIFMGQSFFAMIGACLAFMIKYHVNIWSTILTVLMVLLFVFLNIIRYHKIIKGEIYEDLLNRF